MEKCIIGIDVGGTNFRIGAVGNDGMITDFRKMPVKQVFCTQDPLRDLSGYLKAYCGHKEVQALSIGFPATLDAARETVLQAPNVAFMENLSVVKALEEQMHVPVFIERDVTMALTFDCCKYQIDEEGIVCGFYFGTGIGNAVSIHGRPLVGKHGTAGELGHIPVDGSNEVCGCGNIGCMENLAGGKYLAHLCNTVFTQTHIGDLFYRHGTEPQLLEFVNRMAMTVAMEINILDPHWVLIGGGVPAMAAFPEEYLLRRIQFYARKPYPAKDLNVIFTGDEEDKCVIGAAMYARKRSGLL